MLKIKTFKVGDDSINEFISSVGVLQDGLKISGDMIVIVYRDNHFPEFNLDAQLQDLYSQMYQEKASLAQTERELKYVGMVEPSEQTEVTIKQLEDKKSKTETMINVLVEEIKVCSEA